MGASSFPPSTRRALGLQVGDEIILQLEGDEVRLFTPRQAIRRAQAILRRYVSEGRALSEEFITERHGEAAREESGGL